MHSLPYNDQVATFYLSKLQLDGKREKKREIAFEDHFLQLMQLFFIGRCKEAVIIWGI